MSPAQWALCGWVALSSLAWLAMYLPTLGRLRALRRLRAWAAEQTTLPRWPRVSVVIPARDEGHAIEDALRTLLAQDYPELEIVVVDDRSTDQTGAVIDRLAATSPRVRAVHVDVLPAGWLGKVHALHVGVQHARGEWLLFSDADVHFAPGALRKALATAERDGLDHLALCPDLGGRGLLHRVLIETFVLTLLFLIKPEKIADPRREEAMGVGAFNLVRRAAFERTEGFAWLRMDLADDVALGALLKRSGALGRVGIAYEDLHVQWYDSLCGMIRGLERVPFAGMCNFSYARALAALLGWALVLAGPPLGLLLAVPWAWPLAAAAFVAQLATSGASARALDRPLLPVLLLYVGQWLELFVLARSTLLYLRRGGACWRGTRYSRQELRAGQRVRIAPF